MKQQRKINHLLDSGLMDNPIWIKIFLDIEIRNGRIAYWIEFKNAGKGVQVMFFQFC